MRQRGGEGFGGVEPRSTPTGRVAPLLADVIYEGTERAIDEAMQVLLDGLSRPDKTQRLAAAAYLLRHTEAGPRRGWGRSRTPCRETAEPQAVTLKWID
jgi:hypothetical protein